MPEKKGNNPYFMSILERVAKLEVIAKNNADEILSLKGKAEQIEGKISKALIFAVVTLITVILNVVFWLVFR